MSNHDRVSFSQLHENEYKAYAAVEAMQEISALSKENATQVHFGHSPFLRHLMQDFLYFAPGMGMGRFKYDKIV